MLDLTSPIPAEVSATPDTEIPIADGMTVLAAVGDHAVNPLEVPVCAHRSFTFEVEVAELMDDEGAMVGRRVQVRLLCAECAGPVRFDPTSSIVSADAGKMAVCFDVG